MGVEPTGDRKTCRPPVLKTGTITGPHALPCVLSLSNIGSLIHATFFHSTAFATRRQRMQKPNSVPCFMPLFYTGIHHAQESEEAGVSGDWFVQRSDRCAGK